MVKEICTNYGELFEIWFDGGADHPANGAPDVLPIVQQYQPNCLFYHNKQLAEARWGGSETGTVGYPCWSTFPYISTGAGESAHHDIALDNFALLKNGDPDGDFWLPAMADAPLRGYEDSHEWFWEPGDEESLFPVEALMEMYEKSVGRNATLIMGLTPDTSGQLPVSDVQRLQDWGAEIQRLYAKPVASTAGRGNLLTLDFTTSHTIDHVVFQEDISLGERIREYDIEVRVNKVWQKIGDGTAVGHKRLQKFDPVSCDGIRLIIQKAIDQPLITNFTVYSFE
jgi:alpha-L-fucosidase